MSRVNPYDVDCRPVSGELTYGIERIAMYLQDKDTIYECVYSDSCVPPVLYGDVYKRAGIDLATAAPYQALIARMNRIMDEIEAVKR